MSQEILLSEISLQKRKRLDTLRQEVASLFEQREYMITYERNNLIALYTDLIGKLQYEEFALKVDVMRLKRKSQLIQIAINRGERINIEKINQQLEVEFIEYQQQIENQLESIREAQAYLSSPVLSEEDANDMKCIYRLLVKSLHPDWNANLTQERHDLFIRVQAAYKSSNVQELRNILLLLETEESFPLQTNSIDDDIKRLEESKNDLVKRIKTLRNSFPYTCKKQLCDEQWVKQKQSEIREAISCLNIEKIKWETFIVTLSNNLPFYGQA